MSDKPGSPMLDAEHAALLQKLVEGLGMRSAGGRAGIRAVLREIEAAAPGAMEMMAANLQLRRLGLSLTAH